MLNPDHQNTVQQTISSFFHAVETGDWATVHSLLSNPVDVLHGPNRQTLHRDRLARDWENAHAEYATTQYLLQPVAVETATGRATARLQSQVSLVRADAPDAEPVVIDGHHTIELALAPDGWKIRSIRHDPTG